MKPIIAISNAIQRGILQPGASEYLETLEQARRQLLPNQLLMVFGDIYALPWNGNVTEEIILATFDTVGNPTQEIANQGLIFVAVPEGVVNLQQAQFTGNPVQTVLLPTTLTEIPMDMCAECGELKNITIPEGVQIINENAFIACSLLEDVSLPSTLREIKDRAFAMCVSADITIPDTVAVIGEDAFADVPHITYHGSATGAPWGAQSMN